MGMQILGECFILQFFIDSITTSVQSVLPSNLKTISDNCLRKATLISFFENVFNILSSSLVIVNRITPIYLMVFTYTPPQAESSFNALSLIA